jgi:dUTPase
VLQNSPCLGDEDYTGEYVLKFRCIPTLGGLSSFTGNISLYPGEEFPYKPGDRIAQMYLEEVIPIEFEEVEELSNTERGDGGFGSTGR